MTNLLIGILAGFIGGYLVAAVNGERIHNRRLADHYRDQIEELLGNPPEIKIIHTSVEDEGPDPEIYG